MKPGATCKVFLVCPGCKHEKPFWDFARDRTRYRGRGTYCLECAREHARKWRAANPEGSAMASKRWRMKVMWR